MRKRVKNVSFYFRIFEQTKIRKELRKIYYKTRAVFFGLTENKPQDFLKTKDLLC